MALVDPAPTPVRRPGAAPTTVLIVDDSAVVRQVLSAAFATDPGVEVIGTAIDPIFAMQQMNRRWPDVVVLDIEMPRMDGLTFLRKLMSVRPTPVVVCSTLTEQGTATAMQAMAAGAMAVVTKPTVGLKRFLEEESAELLGTVKAAAAGNMRRHRETSMTLARRSRPSTGPVVGDAARPTGAPASYGVRQPGASLSVTTDRVVAIGCSTGGTQALEVVLTSLPRVSAGIVVVQHMPEKFTAAFAKRLNSICDSEVLEAGDGDRVLPGHALIAPGGSHMAIERNGAQYRVRISDGPPVNRHRPSVDVLFESVARHGGANAMGVIMTGMGDDGARGLLRMRQAGAQTVGQDEASCVVYGMPLAARQLGAVETEVDLGSISTSIQRFASAS